MNERILTQLKQNMCFRITHYYSDYFVRIICIWDHNNSIPCSSGFKHELVGQVRTKPPFKLGNLFIKNTGEAATCRPKAVPYPPIASPVVGMALRA